MQEQSASWSAEHREECRVRSKNWRAEHLEKCTKNHREWARKSGKFYKKKLIYEHTGLPGERNKSDISMEDYGEYISTL
jgi:hypothetical protein